MAPEGIRDALKEGIKETLMNAGRFVTADELLERFPVRCTDRNTGIRAIKSRIEELKNEGCPVAGLPGGIGKGYFWITDARDPAQAEIIVRVNRDMKSRIGAMARHLARFDQATATRVQTALGI